MIPISMIIPVRNDAARLAETLACLEPCRQSLEVIVVDGGSLDGVGRVAERFKWIRLLSSAPGRARQMNHGARHAHGKILLFLHADTRLAPGWLEPVRQAVGNPDFSIGAFLFQLDEKGIAYRLLEWGVNVRSRVLRLPYGDQALFVNAEKFHGLDGYPEIVLMEDVELVRKMRKAGDYVLLNHHAVSSSRKWIRDGVLSRTFRNWRTWLRYAMGQNGHAILEHYRGRRWAMIIFCKKPEPGRVKTRLAATIGEASAVAIYKAMVLHTLAAAHHCRGDPDIFVFYDPPDAAQAIQAWLGPGIRYLPQTPGDLGHRMQNAFEKIFSEGFTDAVIVGTDCPALLPDHLCEAFHRMKKADVVLGPTDDGGYYLIGAKRVHPALFEDIPWSTDKVYSRTMAAVKRAGLRGARLVQLKDLDTEVDLQHHQRQGNLA